MFARFQVHNFEGVPAQAAGELHVGLAASLSMLLSRVGRGSSVESKRSRTAPAAYIAPR